MKVLNKADSTGMTDKAGQSMATDSVQTRWEMEGGCAGARPCRRRRKVVLMSVRVAGVYDTSTMMMKCCGGGGVNNLDAWPIPVG
jgi:hypothetical protein